MVRPTAATMLAQDTEGLTSYSGVAAALNEAFTWPDGRVVNRQQVERWSARGTLNKMGQTPPSPEYRRRKVARTSPSKMFYPSPWVQWARAGVPESRTAPGAKMRGWRNTGWTVPVERAS